MPPVPLWRWRQERHNRVGSRRTGARPPCAGRKDLVSAQEHTCRWPRVFGRATWRATARLKDRLTVQFMLTDRTGAGKQSEKSARELRCLATTQSPGEPLKGEKSEVSTRLSASQSTPDWSGDPCLVRGTRQTAIASKALGTGNLYLQNAKSQTVRRHVVCRPTPRAVIQASETKGSQLRAERLFAS
jgi:hypothetical protein